MTDVGGADPTGQPPVPPSAEAGADTRGRSPYDAPQVSQLLEEVIEVLAAARPLPLSTSVKLDNQAHLVELLQEAIERLPEELRAAKWLLKQREDFLAKTRHESDAILDRARGRAEQMVQRTEVVKAAESRARQVIDAADAEARRLKLEAEDFCDQRLASFEIVLDRTMKVVGAGRAKLQGTTSNESATLEGAASTPASTEPAASKSGSAPQGPAESGPDSGPVDSAPDGAPARPRPSPRPPSGARFFDQDTD